MTNWQSGPDRSGDMAGNMLKTGSTARSGGLALSLGRRGRKYGFQDDF
jgi:hypothetical protein